MTVPVCRWCERPLDEPIDDCLGIVVPMLGVWFHASCFDIAATVEAILGEIWSE